MQQLVAGHEKHSVQHNRPQTTFKGGKHQEATFSPVESQVELDLLSALETESQPDVFNIVAKVLESDGFSINGIKNSDVRHPVDGCRVH